MKQQEQEIAAIFLRHRGGKSWAVENRVLDELIEDFAILLHQTNPRFDERVFKAACKGE